MAELQEQNLRQLLDLLSTEQRQVFDTFIQWVRGKASGPVQSHQSGLQSILQTSPYPALQLLQLLQVHSKLHIGQIIAATLHQLLANGDVSSSSSLCLLANFPDSILEAATLRQKLMTRLASDSASKEHILLALLARSEENLLEDVLHEKEQAMRTQCSEAAPTRQLVLWLALSHREHFVASMCRQLKDFECFQDRTLRNTMLILRLANEFALGAQTLDELGCLDKCLKEFDAGAVPEELQEVHKFFFADFQRLSTLLNFLRPREASKTLKVEALLRAPGVLTLIHDYGIQCEHQELLSLLEDTHKWQLQTPALKCLHQQEMEILSYYTALCHVYNMILDQGEQTTKAKLVQLSGQMRQIHQLGTLCCLLEDIFLLVFLRWEQLEQSPQRREEQDDEEDDDEQYVDDDVSKPQRPTAASHSQRTRYGFVCRSPSLQALFTFLRAFVTKKLHSQDYKCAAEHQQRFQRLVDAISEALCKLGVLNKIEQSLATSAPSLSCLLEPEQLLQLVQLHSTAKEKASSDDESRERSNHASSLNRRKARKQRRAVSFSGAAVSKTSTDGGLTMEQYRARAQLLSGNGSRKNSCVTSPCERSIIPKMLSTPEQLAIMALALKNFNDVKQIIETFHLEQSQLSRELQFMEQQQLVKQKLATIYANYQALEARQANSDETTVEQIKGVAAKGFELSKIISVVDNFAQAQRLQQNPELKALILRHSTNGQPGFLQQFDERNLNALIICDLIVNLGFNREITSNLLLVIRRQQQLKVTGDEALSTSGSSSEIGAMNLLQNLCECMRLLERSGQQPALNELLSRKSYPLRPSVLALQLQRQAAFQTIYGKEPSQYSHGHELRANAGQFQQLRSRHNYYARFCSYVQQLARLLQLRDPNLEYHNTQLLRHDPYEVIGELIYDCGITPLEIESSVAALHLNLVHVIALNICPQLGEETSSKKLPRVVAPQKQESIHNYIAQHNQLLAQVLLAVQLGSLPDSEAGLDFSCLGHVMQLPEVECLATMHEGNRVLAALNTYKLDSLSLEQLVPDQELLLQILLLGIGGQSESQELLKSRIDRLIADLIEKDPRHIKLVVHMSNLGLRASLLKEHFTRISSSQLAKELIERTVQHHRAAKEIPNLLRSQLEHTLSDITIYAKVSALLQFESWPQAYDFGRQTPNVIFEQLLQRRRFGLCLEWSRVVFLAGSAGQQRVCLLTLLDALLELRDGEELDENLLGIVEMFPPSSLVNFLDTHKDKFRSLPLLQWVIDYLEGHARDPRLYRNYQLSLELLRQMAAAERSQFWKLIRHPLLIVEQLVMNARFELLGKLLDAARIKLQREKPLGPCPYCFEKRGHVYDVQSTSSPGTGTGGTSAKVRFQLGQTTPEAFILLNFNSYQQDHFVGQECLDLLLRIYASKALDYHVANLRGECEPSSLGTDVQNSLDSLCGAFVMPKQAPNRQQWTRDEEASHCMCCRRAAFTMLMRRHHCRRCGRVVCYACSTHRMRIPELYDELEVRICNDCAHSLAPRDQVDGISSERSTVSGSGSSSAAGEISKWRLSGIITHDKLLREEFSYEHAPSVALSLSILRNHVEQRSCVELLLFHCRKLEKLIVPSPEVDYGLVAKMINCLAFAAKVRGAPGEIENIREHSEIVMAVVQQGCESLIPTGPLNNHNLRKLADALVEAEHWTLALEVHLKFGFATTGVMAAHGLACLRAGCYDAAREKFAHCMTRLSSEQLNSNICKSIFGTTTKEETVLLPKKRPQRGPALLQEILMLIASMPQSQPQPETLHRASLIRSSNSSLVSLFSRRREPYVQQRPLQEPALNVMNALAGLRNIAKGHYGGQIPASEEGRRQERGFEESLHYVLTYGSHGDILTFLMRRDELCAALRYWQLQQLDSDLFIQHIFQPHLHCGTLPLLMDELQQMEDAQLSSWRLPLLQTCRHLEQQQQLNSLYQLQLLLKDPIRASMTCVRFYPLHCENFQKLQANAQHLVSAHMHLQGELDLAEWEHLQRQQQGRRGSGASAASVRGACFAMQMDARALNGHINTIRRQLEVAKFLAKCEREQAPDEPLKTMQTLKQIRLEANRGTLPTLFEGAADRIQLAILVLLCGKNIDEGFGLAYGIMQDYKLATIKVFGATAKYLARNQRLAEVERLLDCIGSNNGGGGSSAESDEILSIAINSAVHSNVPETKHTLDRLINRIGSVELRISSYIYIGQLKSAYLLANKHERLMDIRRILRQAELTGQVHIKKLCEMKLQLSAQPTPL